MLFLEKLKKNNILYIAIGVALLAILAFILWFFLANRDQSNLENETQPFPTSGTADRSGLVTPEREFESRSDIDPRRNPLYQIWQKPVAGFGWRVSESGEAFVRFVERETGHIYEHSPETGATRQISRITVPRLQKADLFYNAEHLTLQYFDADGALQTFIGKLSPSEVGEDTFLLDGVFLPENIRALSVSPSGEQVAFSYKLGQGEYAIMVAGKDGGNRAVVYESPLSVWHIAWRDEETLYLTPGVSEGDQEGLLITINTQTGTSHMSVESNLLSVHTIAEGVTAKTRMFSDRLITFVENEEGGESEITFPTPGEKCSEGISTLVVCFTPQESLTLTRYREHLRGELKVESAPILFNPETGSVFELSPFLPQGVFNRFDASTIKIAREEVFNSNLAFIDNNTNTLWYYFVWGNL